MFVERIRESPLFHFVSCVAMQRISIGVAKHKGKLYPDFTYVIMYLSSGWWLHIWSRNKDFSQLVGSQEKAM